MAKIEHVVVLMLENRSFDHMLGFLRNPAEYPIEGLNGNETNPEDPNIPGSPTVQVSRDARYQGDLDPDPAHRTEDVNIQMFGKPDAPFGEPRNNGFVFDYVNRVQGTGSHIMRCFNQQTLPALSTLAREFAICDHWYSSMPGPTWPNRIFAHAATSDGRTDNKPHPYLIRTIFDNLTDAGKSWTVYFHDFPQCLVLPSLQKHAVTGHFKLFREFLKDAVEGKLPAYSFIEPRYADFLFWKANDQHPDHDVKLGEYLIADVYDALRASSLWERTLFVVVYDEHGGLFDHLPPPQTALAVNPDGKVSEKPPFSFDRLGVRVPAVLVSSFIKRGTIDSTVYDHTAIPATLKKIFGLPHFLTRRDAVSKTVETALSLDAPRTDAPLKLPRPGTSAEIESHRQLTQAPMSFEKIQAALAQGIFSRAKLSDAQKDLIKLANSLVLPEEPGRALWMRLSRLIDVEHDAAVHLRDVATRFFELK